MRRQRRSIVPGDADLQPGRQRPAVGTSLTAVDATTPNKARSVGPGCLSAQPWCLPKGVGRSCAMVLLGNSHDRQIRVSSVVVGAASAGTWGQVSIGTFRWVRGTWGGAVDGDRAVQTDQRHARNVRDPSRVLEQGPDRQRTPGWCSGGVSSIAGASWGDGLSISLLAAQGNPSFHALLHGPSRSRLDCLGLGPCRRERPHWPRAAALPRLAREVVSVKAA